MQDLYLLDVFMNINTDEVAPDICNHDDGKHISHTFLYSDVRVFNIEAAALESFEHSLNLASACTFPVIPRRYNKKQRSEALAFPHCP